MMTHYNWHEIEDKISLQGRTWIHENKLHYNWSCSGFTVKFKGTVLFAELEAQSSEEYDGTPGDPNVPHRTVWPWVSVFVDGSEEPARTFEINDRATSHLLYACGDEAEHVIRVVKLTENIKTGLALSGLCTDGSILSQPKTQDKKRIEFIGDSITCGFGLGTEEKDRFYYPQEENVWMAHGPTPRQEAENVTATEKGE